MPLECLPVSDSLSMGEARRAELDIDRDLAADLGQTAVSISDQGWYENKALERVPIDDAVSAAMAKRVSIPPDTELSSSSAKLHPVTRVQVSNETTFGASRRLVDAGMRPLALNFANGIQPGGGFLGGARAQEECLCRSSALYVTLRGDEMYASHRNREIADSTDWCIVSPDVPVFRGDDGSALDEPWQVSVVTCAAPVATRVGQPLAGDLLQLRIHRVLAVARSFGYEALVLGAWGCGAFRGDSERTARDFRSALEGEFDGAFSDVVFAITDWSAERRFLRPFARVFEGAEA